MDLRDSVCIVTGAGRGIGFALAERFVAEGARGVGIVDLDPAECAAAAGRIGAHALDAAADVSNPDELAGAITRVEERYGPTDLFVANAGIGIAQGLDASDDDWDRVWQVNVMAHVRAARIVVPGMIERGGGYVLTTASAAGLLTQIGDAAYSVTKHGAVAFAEWLAITYGDRGLKVSCLCPQGVNTELLAAAMRGASGETVAMQGVIEPADVADAVVAGLADERFLILPHPEVAEYLQRKANDPDRWIRGMRRLQARVVGAEAQGDAGG